MTLKKAKHKDFNLSEAIDTWTGYLCTEIGAGRFREGVSALIQHMRHNAFQEGMAQGFKDGYAKGKKEA